MKFFRFRSALRDKAADDARISSIRAAVQSAIGSAESELAGVTARVNDASAAAAFAYDKADENYATRSAADEMSISVPEALLLAATQRSVKLKQHLSTLRDLESIVSAKFPKSD